MSHTPDLDTPVPALTASDVYGFAAALRDHSTAMFEQVTAALDTFGEASAMRDDRPWAADPRNEPAQPIVDYHNEAMDLALQQLRGMAGRFSRLSGLTDDIVAMFQTQDELNAAELDDIHALVNQTGAIEE